jgi:urea transport system permease protein
MNVENLATTSSAHIQSAQTTRGLYRLLGNQPRSAIAIAVCFAILLILPWLHLLPADSSLYLSAYWVTLIGKIMCLALVALALDLVWGYAGILSLGHGVYFALGGYAFGMYLMREASGNELPEFMRFLSWTELPWYWLGTEYMLWALVLVVLVPGVVAFIFGYFAFRSKIKGVYFSIITQAMTFAAALLFFRNETGFGGNNGFTGFKSILGFDITSAPMRATLCFLTALILLLCFMGLRYLMHQPYGRVLGAIRDSENRLQYLGYRTLWYKLSAWVLSAVIAGVAGALYVPQAGIINPSEMNPVNSIEMAVWVAAGGRGTLIGPILGAGLVNAVKTYFTVAAPEAWLLILGALFIVVTLFLPHGVVGLFDRFKKKKDEI